MFKSRKWIGTALITLLVIGVLAAGGWSIYRLGFTHGMNKTQSDVLPGAMRLGMHGFGKKEIDPGHKGFKFQHPFQNRRGMEGHKGMFPGRGSDGLHQGSSSPFRGSYSSHWGGGVIFRLLFAATLVGLFVYVVVKIFKPGGWQLSFGPLHNANPDEMEAKKPAGKSGKSSSKKGK